MEEIIKFFTSLFFLSCTYRKQILMASIKIYTFYIFLEAKKINEKDNQK